MVNDKLQNLQSLSFNINFIGFLFIVVAFTIGKLYILINSYNTFWYCLWNWLCMQENERGY